MSSHQVYGTDLGSAPAWVFAPVDTYAAGLGVRGKQPMAVGALRFFVTGRRSEDGRELASYDPPVQLLVYKNTIGRFIFLNEVTDTEGVTRRPYFRPGGYDLRIEAEFYQTVIVENVSLPLSEQALVVNLQPGYRYPFPHFRQPQNGGGATLLRGCVVTPDGRGVANAWVEAIDKTPPVRYLTDSTGQFVLVFTEDQKDEVISITITLPGAQPVLVEDVSLHRGQSTNLPLTRVQGQVVDTHGRGIAGVAIRVEELDGMSVSGTAGSWCYTFPLNQSKSRVRFIAEGPNGARKRSEPVDVIPGATARGPIIDMASG